MYKFLQLFPGWGKGKGYSFQFSTLLQRHSASSKKIGVGRPGTAPPRSGRAWRIYFSFRFSQLYSLSPAGRRSFPTIHVFSFLVPRKPDSRQPLRPRGSSPYLKPSLFRRPVTPGAAGGGEPSSFLCLVFLPWGEEQESAEPSEFLPPHTPGSHASRGRRGGMRVLSRPLPGPRSLSPGPTIPTALGFTRSPAGPPPPGRSLPRGRPLGGHRL